MKPISLVVAAVALLLASTVAFAQTARYLGMGMTGIAVADDAGALQFNPANLASLDIALPAAAHPQYDPWAHPWDWQVAGSLEVSGDLDYKALHLAGGNSQNGYGLGAYWADTMGADEWSVGFGVQQGANWSWGLGVQNLGSGGGSDTLLHAGLLYEVPQEDASYEPVRLGLHLQDLTDETNNGPFFNLGIAVPLARCLREDVLLVADWWDVSDEIDSTYNLGVEYVAPNEWAVRAGLIGGDELTAGLGYDGGTWKLDLAWAESEQPAVDDEIVATFSRSFK